MNPETDRQKLPSALPERTELDVAIEDDLSVALALLTHRFAKFQSRVTALQTQHPDAESQRHLAEISQHVFAAMQSLQAANRAVWGEQRAIAPAPSRG